METLAALCERAQDALGESERTARWYKRWHIIAVCVVTWAPSTRC